MKKKRRIVVRGDQRADIDPLILMQVVLALGEEWDKAKSKMASPDTYDAAIEDALGPDS